MLAPPASEDEALVIPTYDEIYKIEEEDGVPAAEQLNARTS